MIILVNVVVLSGLLRFEVWLEGFVKVEESVVWIWLVVLVCLR